MTKVDAIKKTGTLKTCRECGTQDLYENFPQALNKSGNYCGAPAGDALNGIDRCDPRFGYLRNNVVTACTVCNFNKQSLSKDEFLQWVAKIAKYHKLLITERI